MMLLVIQSIHLIVAFVEPAKQEIMLLQQTPWIEDYDGRRENMTPKMPRDE